VSVALVLPRVAALVLFAVATNKYVFGKSVTADIFVLPTAAKDRCGNCITASDEAIIVGINIFAANLLALIKLNFNFVSPS
jgi:hypothetical protein